MNPVISPLLLLNLASSSSFGLPAMVVISLLSILVLYFLGRIFVNELKKRYDAYEEHEQIIKAQNDQIYRLQVKNELRNEFKDELQESYKLAGMSKGYQEATAMLPGFYNNLLSLNKQLYDEHKTYIIGSVKGESKYQMLLEAGKNRDKRLETAIENEETLRGNQTELKKQLKGREKERDIYKTELDKAVAENEELKRRLEFFQPNLDVLPHEATGEEEEKSFEKLRKASPDASKSFEKASPELRKASNIVEMKGADEANRSFSKPLRSFSSEKPQFLKPFTDSEIYSYAEHKKFIMKDRMFQQAGWTGYVDILYKDNGDKVGQFRAKDLLPGETYFINEVVGHVVLCALPDCHTVKITSHATTKCCCKEHTDRFNKMRKESIKTGS